MNIVNMMFDNSGLPEHSLSMGGTLGLWNIANNKIIHLPAYIIYLRISKDDDLKKFLSARINTVRKQIGTVQGLFKDKDFDVPREQHWDMKLKEESPVIIPDTILDDEEIAMLMRENLRAALNIGAEALRDATIPEARSTIYDILKKDNKYYAELTELQNRKNWVENFTPMLEQQ